MTYEILLVVGLSRSYPHSSVFGAVSTVDAMDAVAAMDAINVIAMALGSHEQIGHGRHGHHGRH